MNYEAVPLLTKSSKEVTGSGTIRSAFDQLAARVHRGAADVAWKVQAKLKPGDQ